MSVKVYSPLLWYKADFDSIVDGDQADLPLDLLDSELRNGENQK